MAGIQVLLFFPLHECEMFGINILLFGSLRLFFLFFFIFMALLELFTGAYVHVFNTFLSLVVFEHCHVTFSNHFTGKTTSAMEADTDGQVPICSQGKPHANL